MLQIPYFQKKISGEIAEYLEKRLQTPVKIEKINYELFNKLILKDIYVEDQSGEVAFQAKRLAANFEFFSLFKNRFRIHSVQLFTFELNLHRENEDAPLNIQYIIDAFAKTDSIDEKQNIDLNISKINLRLGNLSYRVNDSHPSSEIFNPKNIQLNDISAKIHLKYLSDKNFVFKIDRLGFKEQSGFEVKRLALDLHADNQEASIKELSLQLNRSVLKISDVFLDYSRYNADTKNLEDIEFRLSINPSGIYLNELKAFLPAFSQFSDQVSISGDFTGNLTDFSFIDGYIQDNEHFLIKTNISIRNLFDEPDNLYLRGEINESFISPEGISRIVNNFQEGSVNLPKEINNLGKIQFNGEVNGHLKDLHTLGSFNSDIGKIDADVNLGLIQSPFIKGHVATDSLNLNQLLQNDSFGDIVFNINIDAKENEKKAFEGLIDANFDRFIYKRHTYENIALDGEFSNTHFKGVFNLDDPNGKILAEGLFAFDGINSEFRFQADLVDLELDKLNLTDKYKDSSFSLFADAQFSGNNPDNMLGKITLRNIDFATEGGRIIMDSLVVNSQETDEQKKVITLQSPIVRGEIKGDLSFRSLWASVLQLASQHIPSVIAPKSNFMIDGENDFTIDFTVEEIKDLSNILKLPFANLAQTTIKGHYNDLENQLSLQANIPKAKVKGSNIESTKINLNTNIENIVLDIQGILLQKKSNNMNFNAQIIAMNNSVNSVLDWGKQTDKYHGKLDVTTRFSKEERSPLQTQMNIHQSEMVFNDSIWTLHPSIVQIKSGNIQIHNLLASHKEQFVKINGGISHLPEEELLLELNKVNLDYIFETLAIKALTFGGSATGYVSAKDVFKTRELSTKLDIRDFSFNYVTFGDLDLTGTWDNESQGILMDGFVYKNDSTTVDVDGIIWPVKEEISIVFDAKNTDASFLRKYLDSVVQDLTGELTGKLRLFGDLNDPTVEGQVYAKDMRFLIEYLNTYYTFTDSVTCLPDEISIKNVSIRDINGNSALANGYVKHNLFTDFQFHATLNFENFMVFNATKKTNPLFYGSAFGTGNAVLSGTEKNVSIDVSARNTENTYITLNFMGEEDISDYDFINFITHDKDSVQATNETTHIFRNGFDNDSGTEIRFNLMLDITPNATFDMIMDPGSGDKINGYGAGNMQIQYGTKMPLRMFGNYRITEGKYNFSLQQVLFRNFNIHEGSTISFRGDPFAAELDIQAAYRVTANLGDLDQELIRQSQNKSVRNNIPVDCILKISGPLEHPNIAFDIDLPFATTELTRQVKSYIRTEDMMNRQIVYLLVLSRFYTAPEYIRSDSQYNNDLSYLTSTLSTQLTNFLGSLNNSNNFQVGTKFHQSYEGDQTSTEIELLLSSQLLNNRLIINGNFGYIDNPYIQNSNRNVPLVGDFDIEYKLTPSGDIRLKGFNHYNYRNYFSQTPEMTQGLGIIFRKDFNHFLELFGRKTETETEDKKTENETAETDNSEKNEEEKAENENGE